MKIGGDREGGWTKFWKGGIGNIRTSMKEGVGGWKHIRSFALKSGKTKQRNQWRSGKRMHCIYEVTPRQEHTWFSVFI